MKSETSSSQIIAKLMFRLLPIQILLAMIGAVNGIISSLFAGNSIGSQAMSAVGLYGPVSMLLGAISTLLMGGSQILCGKYMGSNLVEKMQNVFSLDLTVSVLTGILFTILNLVVAAFDLSGFLAREEAVRPLFNRYMLGAAIGSLPTVLSAQLSAFLSLENQNRRVTVASVVCIAVNTVLTYLFVVVLKMDVLGLSLASSLSMWVFLAVESSYFLSKKATLRFTFRHMQWRDSGEIAKIGLPGAIGYGYQTIRGLVVNNLLITYVGSVGMSAFATSNTLLGLFWALPSGMLAVSRMLFSVTVGEEDRQTLIDTMRAMFRQYIPMMCIVCAALITLAVIS